MLAGEPGGLILLTHPAVVTLGRHANPDNIRSEAALDARGVGVQRVDRGGDVTWHGPGQLVGYPIVSLDRLKMGPNAFVCAVADLLRALLADLGIETQYDADAPGLWVGRDKIVAIGMHVHRRVTTHGFALNVCPDLSYYDLIVPCGLPDRGVTSLERLLDPAPSVSEVSARIEAAFEARLGVKPIPAPSV